MAEGKQGGRIGKDSTPPCRVSFMCYNQILLMGGYGFIEDRRVIIFIWGSEVILNPRKQALFESVNFSDADKKKKRSYTSNTQTDRCSAQNYSGQNTDLHYYAIYHSFHFFFSLGVGGIIELTAGF